MLIRIIWRLLAIVFVALGAVGALLPGLPTTVFLLLGVWASSHGWPAFNSWLLQHPRFGPPIESWQRYGAVPRRAKYLAAITMSVSAALIFFSAIPWWAKWALIITMCSVFIWLCKRPERNHYPKRKPHP